MCSVGGPPGTWLGTTAVNKLKTPELSFYKLPSHKSQPLRRQKWIQAIRREASAGRIGQLCDPDTQYAYVCSKHFVTGKSNIQMSVLYIIYSTFISLNARFWGDSL